MTVSTAFCTSAKLELLSAAHCFEATVTPTGNTSNASAAVTSVSSLAGVVVGASVTGTGIAANTFIAAIPSTSSITLSQAATATNTGTTLTIGADVFMMALISATPTGTYGAGSTNYSNITGNSDEVSGAGYTAGGVALTNVSPVISGTTAYVNWSPNPAWTSATLSTSGCMIYNATARLGGVAGRAIATYSFGGVQTVSAGTLTVLMPVAAPGTAIVAVS